MLRRIAYLSAFLALAALGLLFTALNPQRFDVDIGVTRFGMSAGLALLIAFSAGLLDGRGMALELDRTAAGRARPSAPRAPARGVAPAGRSPDC